MKIEISSSSKPIDQAEQADEKAGSEAPSIEQRHALLLPLEVDFPKIDKAMLPEMKKNEDGSLTQYIQKDRPGADKESNWLPAPSGPIYLVMRLYWPKEAALDGSWKDPNLEIVK